MSDGRLGILVIVARSSDVHIWATSYYLPPSSTSPIPSVRHPSISLPCHTQISHRTQRFLAMLIPDPPPQRAQYTATVDLLSGSDIESFVDAVSANKVDIPSILGFRIYAGNVSQLVGDAFAAFIMKHRGVFKISHLEIHHAEEFLGSTHRLVYAFAACITIAHVTLGEVGDLGRELLVRSRFSLISANLTMPGDLDEELDEPDSEEDDSEDDDSDDSNNQRDPDYYARHNPIVLLRNSRRTLESLTGSGCKTLCAKAKTIKDLSYKQVYPHVTNLELHQRNEIPFAFRLVNAFPNLRTLHISFSLDAIMEVGDTPKSVRERRRVNQDKQWVFGTWKSLEACYAPLFEHYLLGLTCRVEELHILGDHMDPDMFFQVVRRTEPAHLSLDGFDADAFTLGFAEVLSQLDHAVTKLQSLEVALDLGSTLRPDEIDVAKTLAEMTSTLQPLRIRSFRLSLAVSIHGRPRPPLELVPMCAQLERYLEALDLDALATRVRKSVPSLQTVALRLSGHPTRPLMTATHGAERNTVPMLCDSSGVV
ncbi:hypothetical protein LXA43DRAFT_476905 [Ganoderma leucocontextum]|nr:hypothetical protein LXA43DRAFT_476905 [Ganoderma leucocontextum]